MSTPKTPADSRSSSTGPLNRHAPTAVEHQRVLLDRLLKDPTKAVYIPSAPKEKTIRPAREMMKNVQGSSAGAGSGEFHVYKASRRREYERLKLLDETAQKEADEAEFEQRRKEAETLADAKTMKNRVKRQKKKDRRKGKGSAEQPDADEQGPAGSARDAPIKKRRLVSGKELVFRRPGEDSEEDKSADETQAAEDTVTDQKIIIHEDN